jgi:hypothetical protein
MAVLFTIADVIEQVDGAGEEREGRERQQGASQHPRVVELVGEDQRRQDEDVLGPLPGPQRVKQFEQHRTLL